MKNYMYDHGYPENWSDVFVEWRQGYKTSVNSLHEHDFYEINLILSGNVQILLADEMVETTQNHIVLTRPDTPHFISCQSDVLYQRLYLNFSPQFLNFRFPEWEKMEDLFGLCGRIIPLSSQETELCQRIIEGIQQEKDSFRNRLSVLYLLSLLRDIAGIRKSFRRSVPSYVVEALLQIQRHFAEKIVADELADRLHIGRTTLVVNFKKYVGTTMNEYLLEYRLKNAIAFLVKGKTVQETAEACGFGDSCNMIRVFKRKFSMTPKQYLNQMETEKQL